MRNWMRGLTACGLLASGYWLGTQQALNSSVAQAQVSVAVGDLSKETAEKIKLLTDALSVAEGALKQDGKYNPATKGYNAFAVTVGGVDALGDLQSNAVVDPETFALLYAGRAVDEVAADLSKDKDGRLLYKGKVIQMYPISRIAALLEKREALSGQTVE